MLCIDCKLTLLVPTGLNSYLILQHFQCIDFPRSRSVFTPVVVLDVLFHQVQSASSFGATGLRAKEYACRASAEI